MKVETFKIKGWKSRETGLVIMENEDWVLVKHIPVDYVVDGYKLYRKKFIKKRKTKVNEGKIAMVLGLKKIALNAPTSFQFTDTHTLLKWVEDQYGLFEFQESNEEDLYYGKFNKVEDQDFVIDSIDSDGELDTEYDFVFSFDDVRTITFDTDYFKSIKLMFDNLAQ
jgi:hypothetical protein